MSSSKNDTKNWIVPGDLTNGQKQAGDTFHPTQIIIIFTWLLSMNTNIFWIELTEATLTFKLAGRTADILQALLCKIVVPNTSQQSCQLKTGTHRVVARGRRA